MKMVFANVKIDGFQRRFFTIRYKRFDFKRFGFPIKIRIIKNFVIKFKDETKLMKIINEHFFLMKNESITISHVHNRILQTPLILSLTPYASQLTPLI